MLLRSKEDPREFVFIEQFADRHGVKVHLERERELLGLLSDAQIISAFRHFFEEFKSTRYDVVE